MTDFDATQPVPEQADLNKDLGPSAGAALANSAMVPQGPGTGPMRPEAPSFTPPAGSVPAEDNTGKWSNIYKPGMTPQDFHTDLGSTTSRLIQSGVDPMTALLAGGLHALDAMRDVAKEKPPQEDAGQRAGGIVDRFFAPMRGQSGAIGGAGNAAAARIAQTNADQKKKLDEFNEQHKRKMEDIKEGVNLAISNAQMLHSQFLLHKEQGEEQDKNIADGKEAVKLLKSQPTQGVPVMEDVTADEIKRGIEQHTKDPKTGIDMTTMSPYATGKKEVGTDESGNPRYQATYTVMQVPPTTSIPDPALAHKLFPEAKGLENVSAETPLVVPTSLYNARFQSSETSAANKAVMAKQAAEAAKAQGEEAEAIEYSNFDGQTVWSRAQTDAYKNNPKATEPEIAMIAYRNLQKDNIDPATGKPKFPHLQADVRQAYGEKNWDTMQLAAQKAEDARTLETQKAQEKADAAAAKLAAGTNFVGDPKADNPQEFLNSLAPSEQSLVNEIGKGKIVIDRMGYLATRKPEILEAVARAFPDFDSSKAASYPKLYVDYTSGKIGTALNSGGTAMQHLRDLKAINDQHPIQSRIPHTAEYIAYHNLLDTVEGELSQFYNLPKTDSSIQSMGATLGGSISARDAAIDRQVTSMGEKMDNYENQWSEGAPSKAYEAPMPNLSLASRQARAQLDPEYASKNPGIVPSKSPQQPGQPAQPGQNPQSNPGGFTVMTKDGPFTFQTQQQVDSFKKAAGIQ